jgi:GNAT superfamily N-acetyltransferase
MEFEVGKRDDLYKIMELYWQVNDGSDFSDELLMRVSKIWDEIEKNNIKYFIAKENDEIIASCYICIIPNLTHNGKSIGYIENVITDSKYRRKGIGRKIMEMAINYAKKNNCYKIVLQSGIERTDAHKFYENMGFNGLSKKAYEIRFKDKKINTILC